MIREYKNIFFIFIVCGFYLVLICSCYCKNSENIKSASLSKRIIYAKGDVKKGYFSEKSIRFKEISPDKIDEEIVISFSGDLCPWGVNSTNSYDVKYYNNMFTNIKKYIDSCDISFANLELPIAEDYGYNYSYPAPFNGSPDFLNAVKLTGWNIVNAANNHTADRAGIGIDLTIDALNKYKIAYVGIGKKESKDIDFRIMEVKGINVAFMGYTEYLNVDFLDIPLKGRKVSKIDINTSEGDSKNGMHTANLQDIRRICAKIDTLKKNGVDLVIVYVHWGMWGHKMPTIIQTKVAGLLCEGGADIIVGSGPHCLQPFEKIVTYRGRKVNLKSKKGGKEHAVLYSLGDFISKGRASMIVYITVAKTRSGLFLKHLKYLPISSTRLLENINVNNTIKSVHSPRVYSMEETIDLLSNKSIVEYISENKKDDVLIKLKKLYHGVISRFGRHNLMLINELNKQ